MQTTPVNRATLGNLSEIENELDRIFERLAELDRTESAEVEAIFSRIRDRIQKDIPRFVQRRTHELFNPK